VINLSTRPNQSQDVHQRIMDILVLIWSVTVPREFPLLVSRRAPVALVLLAHYAVLFHNATDVWFIGT
jgi:hypothetical protein